MEKKYPNILIIMTALLNFGNIYQGNKNTEEIWKLFEGGWTDLRLDKRHLWRNFLTQITVAKAQKKNNSVV